MWYHIVITDNKLYQNGKEVNELNIPGVVIGIKTDGENTIWLKTKEK